MLSEIRFDIALCFTTECYTDGYHSDVTSCRDFYFCGGGKVRYRLQCKTGLHYDEHSHSCLWPHQVNCQNSP